MQEPEWRPFTNNLLSVSRLLEGTDVYEPEDAEAEEAASREEEEGKRLETESPGPMTTPAEYLLFKKIYF